MMGQDTSSVDRSSGAMQVVTEYSLGDFINVCVQGFEAESPSQNEMAAEAC